MNQDVVIIDRCSTIYEEAAMRIWDKNVSPFIVMDGWIRRRDSKQEGITFF